jgi:hypothetical protein
MFKARIPMPKSIKKTGGETNELEKLV